MSGGDTIFALASPAGRSGVAVVRVSGSCALESAASLTPAPLIPRMASLRTLRSPFDGSVIDKALVLAFEAPASFTGEHVVEYHLHGGRAVIASLLDVLGAQKGHRMAEPGEFTRRGFENGKMDLTEAEAVADLIDAETAAQKSQALAQMGGVLSDLYNGWTQRLKKALAHVEADLEFPDEDMPEGIAPEVMQAVESMRSEIAAHLNDGRRGERLRDGLQVVVIGAPNAGKSSLVNALAQRDVAIVSDMAGTTRDVIEVHLDLGGFPVILADTAGLRPDQIGSEGHDSIESEGIRRALERAENADLKILLFDASEAEQDKHTLALAGDDALVVLNKCDGVRKAPALEGALEISAKSGAGLGDLIAALTTRIDNLIGNRETPSLTRARHRHALIEALESLSRSQNAPLPELMAEDLRLAIRSLGRITGKVDVEDLMDVIFKDFCIGK